MCNSNVREKIPITFISNSKPSYSEYEQFKKENKSLNRNVLEFYSINE